MVNDLFEKIVILRRLGEECIDGSWVGLEIRSGLKDARL